MIHEFDLINRYFKPQLVLRNDVALGIGDDCALLSPPHGQLLAITTDTLVENIHFFPHACAKSLGHKVVAVSLSDLAACGAEPAWATLSLTLPSIDVQWLDKFSATFLRVLQQYRVQLVGGNTTRGPLSITTQLIGFVPQTLALRRDNAQPGDDIYVTGTLGDAGIALSCLKHIHPLSAQALAQIQHRLDYPIPRVKAGLVIRDKIHAAIDISDGLAADLGHILAQSQVGATVYLAELPLSSILQQLPKTTAWQAALTAGEDYELCFTAAPTQRTAIEAALTNIGCPCQRVGTIELAPGLRVRYPDGQPFPLQQRGFTHF